MAPPSRSVSGTGCHSSWGDPKEPYFGDEMSFPIALLPEEREGIQRRIAAAVRTLRGCWVYPTPYPKVTFRGRAVGLHRLSCALNGPLSAGELALHECDEPRCVNPAHLRGGTPAENMEDIVRKNRRQLKKIDLSLPRTQLLTARRKGR